jgi:hypothetical protein
MGGNKSKVQRPLRDWLTNNLFKRCENLHASCLCDSCSRGILSLQLGNGQASRWKERHSPRHLEAPVEGWCARSVPCLSGLRHSTPLPVWLGGYGKIHEQCRRVALAMPLVRKTPLRLRRRVPSAGKVPSRLRKPASSATMVSVCVRVDIRSAPRSNPAFVRFVRPGDKTGT